MTNPEDTGVRVDRAEPRVSTDDLFEALGHATRRRIVTALSTRSEMTLDELAATLAGTESAVEGPDAIERTKAELVHAHLPKLAAAGLVSHDDGVVRRCDYPDAVDDLLAVAHEYEAATPSAQRRE